MPTPTRQHFLIVPLLGAHGTIFFQITTPFSYPPSSSLLPSSFLSFSSSSSFWMNNFYLRFVTRLFLSSVSLITDFLYHTPLQRSNRLANKQRLLLLIFFLFFLQVLSLVFFWRYNSLCSKVHGVPVTVCTVNDHCDEDSQVYWSPFLLWVLTVTFSATKYTVKN